MDYGFYFDLNLGRHQFLHTAEELGTESPAQPSPGRREKNMITIKSHDFFFFFLGICVFLFFIFIRFIF